jgi:hypothetical protein
VHTGGRKWIGEVHGLPGLIVIALVVKLPLTMLTSLAAVADCPQAATTSPSNRGSAERVYTSHFIPEQLPSMPRKAHALRCHPRI